MCGILGFSGKFDLKNWKIALSNLAHRGPDDEGDFFSPSHHIGLGHRRLSILDLSSKGHQPMSDSSGQIQIIYNGEIYNYPELKEGLEKKGYSFRSTTDTEVLLYLYKEYGLALTDKLSGIFSFSIWDSQKEILFLSRDALGVKPLYYHVSSKGFVFSSEIKSLLQLLPEKPSLCPQAIHYYMTYLWVPSPYTILDTVFKFEPGQSMIVKEGQILRKWFHTSFEKENFLDKKAESLEELSCELAKRVEKAVHKQLISDVPVGAFLSGGLDSSAIVAFASKHYDKGKMDCFTIAFENSGNQFEGFAEDLPYAKKVAAHLGVNLHEVSVGPEMVSNLKDMIYALDEPLADPAPLNLGLICSKAKEMGYKVLLSGAGGDDVFSGYRRHQALMMERYISWLPKAMRLLLRHCITALPQDRALGRRLERMSRFWSLGRQERMVGYFSWLHPDLRQSLYDAPIEESIEPNNHFGPLLEYMKSLPKEMDPLEKMLFLERRFFLADHNLNYSDKMGMHHGIEIRVPLLDDELVRYSLSIPTEFKLYKGTTKAIFKKAMEPYLPKEVIYRPKSGFGVPLRQWLKGPLKDEVHEILSVESINKRGFFNTSTIQKLIEKDQKGEIDGTYNIFALICLEWWQRKFLDG